MNTDPPKQPAYPPALEWLGRFLCLFLEHAQQANPGDAKVTLPGLGEVPCATLQLLFRILWRWHGWPAEETLVVSLHEPVSRYYRVDVVDGALRRFVAIDATAANGDDSWRMLAVDVNELATVARQSGLALLLAILRGESTVFNRGEWAWQALCRQFRISPASLELVGRWFFPFSGIGFLFWHGCQAVTCIFYGGLPPTLQLKECVVLARNDADDTGTPPLVEGAQQFRHRHHLAAAVSFDLAAIRDSLTHGQRVIDLLSAYGHGWAVSVPLEINDLLRQLPRLWKLLPLGETFRQCHLDRAHLLSLCQLYCENGWKYLKKNPLYLAIKDNERRLLLEITSEGIFETDAGRQVPGENLFTLDIEILSTLMSWVNDTSLRLMARFVQSILPAEVVEKIDREEQLVWLTLKDEDDRPAHLFLCGGDHNLPGEWQGDFSATLLCPRSRRVLFCELLPQESLVIRDEFPDYRLEFPPASSLKSISLAFRASEQQTMRRGFARIVSPTSVLSEVSPGLRTTISFARQVGNGQGLSLTGKNYRITGGTMLCSDTVGRILKGHHFVSHITHHWLTQDGGGIAVSGMYTHPQPAWWQEWVADTENGVLALQQRRWIAPALHRCRLPYADGERDVLLPQGGMGWAAETLRWWILHAWVVPLDVHGNCLLRVRSVGLAGSQPCVALVELPCRFPGLGEKRLTLAATPRKSRHGISFFIDDTEILHIHGRRYLRMLRPGWLWRWR